LLSLAKNVTRISTLFFFPNLTPCNPPPIISTHPQRTSTKIENGPLDLNPTLNHSSHDSKQRSHQPTSSIQRNTPRRAIRCRRSRRASGRSTGRASGSRRCRRRRIGVCGRGGRRSRTRRGRSRDGGVGGARAGAGAVGLGGVAPGDVGCFGADTAGVLKRGDMLVGGFWDWEMRCGDEALGIFACYAYRTGSCRSRLGLRVGCRRGSSSLGKCSC